MVRQVKQSEGPTKGLTEFICTYPSTENQCGASIHPESGIDVRAIGFDRA
jgi:hypothetical protein